MNIATIATVAALTIASSSDALAIKQETLEQKIPVYYTLPIQEKMPSVPGDEFRVAFGATGSKDKFFYFGRK